MIKVIIGMMDHVVMVVMTTRLVILKKVANTKNGPYSTNFSNIPLWSLFGRLRSKTAIIVAKKEKTIDKDADTGIQRRFPLKSFRNTHSIPKLGGSTPLKMSHKLYVICSGASKHPEIA